MRNSTFLPASFPSLPLVAMTYGGPSGLFSHEVSLTPFPSVCDLPWRLSFLQMWLSSSSSFLSILVSIMPPSRWDPWLWAQNHGVNDGVNDDAIDWSHSTSRVLVLQTANPA